MFQIIHFIYIMRFSKLFLGLSFLLATVLISCHRDDDEPIRSRNSISRLYISYSDFQPNEDEKPFHNIQIIEPADQDDLLLGLKHTSEAKGGAGIHFFPYTGMVFQSESIDAGAQDTTIYIMSVGETGVLNNRGKIMFHQLGGIKGLVYYKSNNNQNEDSSIDNLYAGSVIDSTIYVFEKPNTYANKEVEPIQTFKLSGVAPWKMTLRDRDMLISITGEEGGVAVFKNLVSKREERIDNLSPDYILRIQDAKNIRGVDYDPFTDILVLTDYDDNRGRLLFIENFSSKTSTQTLTADRVIEGSDTGLIDPMDVEVDKRENSKYLYVADRQSKKILRFEKNASGNTAPNQEVSTAPRTPVALALDARGPVDEDTNED